MLGWVLAGRAEFEKKFWKAFSPALGEVQWSTPIGASFVEPMLGALRTSIDNR